MKKVLIIFLLVIAAFLVLLFYLKNKPVVHAKVKKLNFATVMPANAPWSQAVAKWIDSINKKGTGKIKINYYPGASLLKHEEMYRGVKEGIADIVYYSLGDDQGVLELNSYTTLPFIGYKSWKQATVIYNELLHSSKFPELMAEYTDEGIIPYLCRMPPAFQFFNTKRPVRYPKDLKGLKCYTIGNLADTVNKAGGVPVMLQITDVSMSLERGLIQGVFCHLPAMKIFGFLDRQKYGTVFNEGGAYTPMACFLFNAKTWNSLPDDVKKLFTESEAKLLADLDKIDEGEINDGMKISNKLGIEYINLKPRELKEWQKLAKPTVDKWIARMELKGKGAAAKAIWSEVQRQIKVEK